MSGFYDGAGAALSQPGRSSDVWNEEWQGEAGAEGRLCSLEKSPPVPRAPVGFD